MSNLDTPSPNPKNPDSKPTEEDPVANVVSHYASASDEHDRLTSTQAFRLEAIRTRHLLEARLPVPPSAVLDVGGGTGAYASWLQQRGHAVVLVDLVPGHVERARSRGLDAMVADARSLDFPPASMDAVLLMGPLYHLVDPDDRAQVIARARDIVRPGGVVVASAINRWTPLLHLATIGEWDDGLGQWSADVVRRLEGSVRTGVHDHEVSFTTAYLHRPHELAVELVEGGLTDVEVVPVEGPLGTLVDFLPHPDEALDRAVTVATITQHEPSLAGTSLHLLGFARKRPRARS